jgi:5-methylcytosine-specific restriction endonuclease McrA
MSLPAGKQRRVWIRDGWQCRMPKCWCPGGRRIDESLLGTQTDWAPSVDHRRRRADGGTSDLWNLRAAHERCNREDADRLEQLARGVRLAVVVGAETVRALQQLRSSL